MIVPGVGEGCVQVWHQRGAAHVPAAVEQHPAVAVCQVAVVS